MLHKDALILAPEYPHYDSNDHVSLHAAVGAQILSLSDRLQADNERNNPPELRIIRKIASFPDSLQGHIDRTITEIGCQNQPSGQKPVEYRVDESDDILTLTYGYENYSPQKMHEIGVKALLGVRHDAVKKEDRQRVAAACAARLVAEKLPVRVERFSDKDRNYNEYVMKLREDGLDYVTYTEFDVCVMTSLDSQETTLAEVHVINDTEVHAGYAGYVSMQAVGGM